MRSRLDSSIPRASAGTECTNTIPICPSTAKNPRYETFQRGVLRRMVSCGHEVGAVSTQKFSPVFKSRHSVAELANDGTQFSVVAHLLESPREPSPALSLERLFFIHLSIVCSRWLLWCSATNSRSKATPRSRAPLVRLHHSNVFSLF